MKKFFSALFVLGIVVLAASPASSHSVFVGSNPEPDSVIKQMPAEFRLQFNEDLLVIGEDDPNQLKVRDKNGAIVSAASEVAGPFIFAKALSQEFVSGKYDVDYRIVSGDGHVVEGSYSFDYQIEGESAATTAAVKQSPAPKEMDGSKSEHSEHGSFIHVHSDHIAMAGNSFILDPPEIYRYSFPDTSITRHYNDGNISAPAIQVAKPDEGILFTCTDAKIRSSFQYGYPLNKLWPEFLDTNTYYNSQDGYISFYKTETAEAKEFIIEDSFAIPTQIDFISSKVEWRNDLNITVESSLDGITYVSCVNGQPLPQFTKDSFAVTSKVYLKITMSTTDASKYLPRLEFFNINFYTEKDLYADNYGDYITSTTEYYLGSLNYPILSRTFNNGIRAKAGAGFNIVTTNAVKSIELFLTPSDLTASTLFYCPVQGSYASAKYAWNSSGVISKTNIAKIYVNGVDKTTQTNISNYLVAEEPHHIVLVFTNPVSGSIQFNYQSSGGPSTLYKNITTYEKELTQTIVTEHYNLYTGKPSTVVSEPSITVTENTFKYYNNDWVVIQSK